jgi:hypothetical protein
MQIVTAPTQRYDIDCQDTCAENEAAVVIIIVRNVPKDNAKYIVKSISVTGIRKNGVLLPSPSFLIYESDAK